MNERIRELAEQAGIECELLSRWLRPNAYIWTATDDELAKFAELIIAECVAAILTKERHRAEYFARVVQKRFGMLDDDE